VTDAPPRRRSHWAVVAPAAAFVLAALCLRAPFSAVGPVIDELGSELSLSTGALAVVTSLPLVCLGLVSPVAPVIAARVGVHRAIVVGVAVLALGIALRHAGTVGLYAGTGLLSGGIAIANVLLPAAARAEYGERSPVVVGMVVAAMATSASAGAGLGQPLAMLGGSARAGLLLWIVPVLVALVAVAALAHTRRSTPSPVPTTGSSRTAILRDPVALAVTLFFGLQSLSFYAMLTWLPAVLETEAGISPVAAGGLLGLATVLGVPASIVVPPLAARRPSQTGWVAAAAVPTALGIAGLLAAPAAAPVLWAVLYGLGTGAAFPLAMTLMLQRTRDVAQTGRLSASAQSVGYLIAATGPLAVGLLNDATGAWTTSLVLLLAVVVAQTAAGLAAGRPRLVSADA
jgi:CP family cyanate transporter-like MFS transporter